ncbi:MAG: PIN domain-containing protein [Myxococcota bacterium]|nr:PIN domain-containing protein [Myxococcota bacterium]
MVAADTNVAVRVLVSDDLRQQRAIVARLKKVEAAGESVLLTQVVLAEIAWVLESGYGFARDDVLRAIATLVTTSPFVPEDPAIVADALAIASGGSVGLADGLVLATCRARGATPLLTLDRKLLREDGCERP